MKKQSTSTLRVNLMGGLGNQLFIYFAADYLAEKLQLKLELNIGSIPLLGTAHVGDISAFALSGNFVCEEDTKSRFSTYLERADKSLGRQSFLYRSFQSHVLKRFHAVDIGYEARIENIKKLSYMYGYFQTWRFFERNSSRNLKRMTLIDPSEWFLKQSRTAIRENPIGIHVRRGDYTAHKDDFGLLSVDYYRAALEKSTRSYPHRKVWVFSDEIEIAEQLLSVIPNIDFYYVQPPKSSVAAESLLLMSQCSSLIISNSTFSYWAGMVGNREKLVIAPEKWFKARKDPNDLIPPNWTRVKSSWID